MGCSQTGQIPIPEQIKDAKRGKLKNMNIRRKSVDAVDLISEKISIICEKLNEEQLAFAVQKLAEHQLFASLNKRELKVICSEMVVARAQAREYVFKQGELGTCFFLIFKGEVDVEIDKKYVRTLGLGQTFGELALLFQCARTASIICKEQKVECLIMKPTLYKKTLQKMKMQEYSRNVQTIQKVPLFSCLTNKQKYALSNTIKVVVFNQNDVIFRGGDDAQAMYIISQGNVKIQIKGKKDITLKAGEIFGEASVQQNMKRSGTALAIDRVICSMISRKDIQTTLGSSINNLVFYNTKKWALLRSPAFKDLSPSQINKYIIQFQPFFQKDDTVIDPKSHQGFIICLEGSINNKSDAKCYNQQYWMSKTFKCQRLVKNGDGLCGFLSFERAKQLLEEINSKNKLQKQYKKVTQKPKNNFNLSDFQFVKKLGEGQFGQVFLVKNLQFGTNLYAIKCLVKQQIKKEEIQSSVVQQRKILQKTVFPYIVGYVKAFHDKKHIYLLMEYIHGRQMFDTIRQVKNMTTQMVKYFFACLMVSIEYLHNHSIIYRDLKPQNAVVDHRGKVYLIDLGTAKELTSDQFFKTFTIIGTPHYMAPQVFEGNGYSFQADIWSLGCLLYEFLCYGLPFGENLASDPYAIYSAIKKGTVTFPKFLKDQKAKKLINSLLVKNPKQRSEVTFDRIKKSQFFKDFDWNSLMEQQMKGPYIPKQFRDNPIQKLYNAQSKDFLKYLYKSQDNFQIQEWNSSTI